MRLLIVAQALVLSAPASVAPAQQTLTQDLAKGDALVIASAEEAPAQVTQNGKLKPYANGYTDIGLIFDTGAEATIDTTIRGANSVASTVIGVRGTDTHIRYTGTWHGDDSSAFPILVLTDGGHMTWEPEAEIDFVMDPNFFTRQLWVHGDGTGTLELAEGFVSDRTQDATVANAMGTIRLGGATLVTHHSQSLPYNTRPDGRGGVYHNGHVVFEQKPGSTWIIRANQHIYSAQIDFDVDGTIDCQKPLTHNGQRRVCLRVGNGGPFVSTGAFRTTAQNVTITKTGPAMLSLDGQQSYKPGSRLVIEQGLVRMHTDPGAGAKVAQDAGPFLEIEVKPGAKLHLAADAALRSVRLHAGAAMSIEEDVTVSVSDGVTLEADATLVGEDRIKGAINRGQ